MRLVPPFKLTTWNISVKVSESSCLLKEAAFRNMTVIDLGWHSYNLLWLLIGDQLKTNCSIENIEGNRHLIDWFFTAIDQLTPTSAEGSCFSSMGWAVFSWRIPKTATRNIHRNELTNYEPLSISFSKQSRFIALICMKMPTNLKISPVRHGKLDKIKLNRYQQIKTKKTHIWI